MSRQRTKPVAELSPRQAKLEHARLEEEIAELKSSEKVDAELEAMKAALKAKGE